MTTPLFRYGFGIAEFSFRIRQLDLLPEPTYRFFATPHPSLLPTGGEGWGEGNPVKNLVWKKAGEVWAAYSIAE